MSAMPTAHLRHARHVIVLGALVATLGLPGVASATYGGGQDHWNPNCSDISDGAWRQAKLDPVPQGTKTFGDGALSVTVTVTGKSFDWTASRGVDAIIVKGGPKPNIYRYAPEATSGTGLHAPLSWKGTPYGLSHITVCWDAEDPRTPGPCEDGGPITKPDGSPCIPADPPVDPDPPKNDPPKNDPPKNDPPKNDPPSPPVQITIPSSGVAPAVAAQVPRARAAMRRPSRCVTRSLTARINGSGIRRVTMFLNGRRVRVVRGNGRTQRLAIRISAAGARGRVLRVRARVEYVAASGRRAQNLTFTALRCAQETRSASFTG